MNIFLKPVQLCLGLFSAVLLLAAGSAGHAAVLVSYPTSAASGLNPSAPVSGLTATALSTAIPNNTALAGGGGNIYVRVHVTPDSELGALANNTYWQFNLQSAQGFNLENISFTTNPQANAGYSFTGTVFVRSSADNYSSNLASYTYTNGQGSTARSVELSNAAHQNLNDVTFRFYFYDDSQDYNANGGTAIVHRFSNIVVNGSLVPEPGRAMLGMIALGALFMRRRR